MAASRPSTEGDGGSGAQFASQLSGLTAESADAGAWRSTRPANLPKAAENGTPVSPAAALTVRSPAVAPSTPLDETPSASLGRVNIAFAAHSAVPSFPYTAASRPSTEGDAGSGAQFASQFSGLTAESADAGAWRSARPANLPKAAENGTPVSPATALTVRSPAVAPTLDETPLPDDSAGVSIEPKANLQKAPIGQNAAAGVTPSGAATSKRAIAGQSPAQKAPHGQAVAGESTQTAAVATWPAPAPESAVTLSAVTDDPIDNDGANPPLEAAAPPSAKSDAAESSAPTVTAAAGPAQPSQEMAFAARVQPVQSVDHAALPAEMASASAMASASKKVVAAADDENATPANAQGLLASAATATEPSAEPNAAPSPAAPLAATASHRAETPASPAESLPKASAPLKDISLQVSQPGRERVDVRVVQQGSEVHVSVHSSDASLTSGLRQGLSDLQSRLEENGYRSETWRPGASTVPLAQPSSAQASTNHSRGGDGQPQQGGPQQEGGRRNQNQSNQPRWVSELESSLTGGEQSSGGFYGFSS